MAKQHGKARPVQVWFSTSLTMPRIAPAKHSRIAAPDGSEIKD